MPATCTLRVNGATRFVTVEQGTPPLHVLRNDLEPNDADFGSGQALNRHLCRCGSHDRIVKAVRRASGGVA